MSDADIEYLKSEADRARVQSVLAQSRAIAAGRKRDGQALEGDLNAAVADIATVNADVAAISTATILVDGSPPASLPNAVQLSSSGVVRIANGGTNAGTAAGAWANLVQNGVNAILRNPMFSTAGLTSVRTVTSTNTLAVYVGKAPKPFAAADTMTFRFRIVTRAIGAVTWCECAIAKGSLSLAGNPTLTPVGYADFSGSIGTAGLYSQSVAISNGQSIAAGDDVWLLFGGQFASAPTLRAASIADDLGCGTSASAVTRPSSNVGSGVAFTIDSTTDLPPWIIAKI